MATTENSAQDSNNGAKAPSQPPLQQRKNPLLGQNSKLFDGGDG